LKLKESGQREFDTRGNELEHFHNNRMQMLPFNSKTTRLLLPKGGKLQQGSSENFWNALLTHLGAVTLPYKVLQNHHWAWQSGLCDSCPSPLSLYLATVMGVTFMITYKRW